MILEWLRRNQNLVVPLSLLLFSLSLLSYGSYSRRQKQQSLFSRLILTLANYGQRVVTGSADAVSGVFQNYVWLVGVKQENERLKHQLAEVRRQNSLLEEKAIENDRLRRLLHFQPSEEIQAWIPARVTGDDLVGFNKTVTIDKGSRNGIRPRMAVITYESILVGQILDEPGSAIGFHTSQVLLLIDRRSRIQVMVQRAESRARGILVGRSETYSCDLLYLQSMEEVQVGDLIITSGFGRIFLKGWPVGVVEKVAQDPSSFYPHIEIRPLADFSRLEEVIVISRRGQEP